MAQVGQELNFHFGTLAQYNAAKEGSTIVENDLYFLSDVKKVYLGQDLYCGPIKLVEALPEENIQQDILYVNTTDSTAQVYTGTKWIKVTPKIVSDASAAEDTDIPNVAAVEALIAKNVDTVAYDNALQKLTFTHFDDTTTEIQLKDLITSIQYSGGTFTIKKLGAEQDQTIQMPVDNFLQNASYSNDTHVLTLTMVTGEPFEVNLEELVDAYSIAAKDASLNVTNSEGAYTLGVKISAESGNSIQLKADGLYVQIPAATLEGVEDTDTVDMTITGTTLKADVKISAQEGNKLTIGQSGEEPANDGLYVAPLTWNEI